MARPLIVVCALVLAAAACGDGDSAASSTTGSPTTLTTMGPATTGAPTTAPPTTAPTTTTQAATTTSTEATTTTAAGPAGEAYDFWVPVPAEGAIVGVVGVRHDDVLNVRSGPGVDFAVIATLDPTRSGITGTGNGWQLPSGSVWWEIEVGGVVGWANQQYLSRLDGVDDLTSLVVDRLGEIPAAETMLDLGLIVANALADVDVGSDVVMSVAPSVGDLGEVTYDVVGIGDDSVGGWRLHVFGQPTAGGEGFSLMSVEATVFCQRGTSDGICV